ncbi:tetratricopeptide repeat protein [Rhodovibrionaceae bacterium A322]
MTDSTQDEHKGGPDTATSPAPEQTGSNPDAEGLPLSLDEDDNLDWGTFDTTSGDKGEPQTITDSSEANLAFVRAVEVHRAGRLNDAIVLYGKTLHLDPHHIQALNNLGVLLRAQKKPDAAEACFRRALSLTPGNAGLHTNLGNLLHGREDLEGALRCHQEAASLRQADWGILHNVGRVLADMGQFDMAVSSFEKAMKDAPKTAAIRTDLALTLMMKGDLRQGALAYEARLDLMRNRPRLDKMPLWEGEPLSDKHLLIYADGSLADSLCFLRFLPWAIAEAEKVTLEISTELYPLAQFIPGLHQVVQSGKRLPDADYRLPLGSLLLKSRCHKSQDLYKAGPYLVAPTDSQLTLQATNQDGLKVGINWANQDSGPRNSVRLPPFRDFLSLAGRPDVSLYTLQKGPRAVDLLDSGGQTLMQDLSPRINSWADLAGIVKQLDLVITIDGPLAHLAGALGVPCWLLTSRRCDWRWRLQDDSHPGTTPWYPTTRFFPKDLERGWAPAFAAIEEALDDLSKGSSSKQSTP